MSVLFSLAATFPWGSILIGVLATCSPCLLLLVLLLIMASFAARSFPHVDSEAWSLDQLRRLRAEIERTQAELADAETRLVGAEGQMSGRSDSELAEGISKCVTRLRDELGRVQMERWNRPFWFKVLQGGAANYLTHFFYFLLGVLVTLFLSQAR